MKATLLLVAIFLACTLSIFAADQPELNLKPALDAITPDGLLAHIKFSPPMNSKAAHREQKEKNFRSNISPIKSP